jgi:DNA helicase II / ATP-dependent DNA helicase PcrA
MIGFTLNAGQEKAVAAQHDQPVRVVAGAGTGKTEVVSRRFINLLRQHSDWRPEHILVLTFSEKAATEMRARIFRSVTEAGLGFKRLDLASASISTFHSFSTRMLSDHSLHAGVDPALPLLSEIDVQHMIDEAQEIFLERDYEATYGTFDPLASEDYKWTDGGPFELAHTLIGQLRNQAISPAAFRERLAAITANENSQTIAPLVDWLYADYVRRLVEHGQLDFDRLIMDAATVIQDASGLRQTIRDRFRAILVDEYQDTNFAQEKLLQALALDGMTNVTVVGDPRQAIYVWREARVENIARFPGDGQRVDAPLTENRRSLRPILDVANRAIEGYEFDSAVEFDSNDILQPSAENDIVEEGVVNLYAAADRQEEAQAIAGWIKQAVEDGYKYRDVAIILRARTYLETYLEALTAASIPYELSAADAFYTRPEILDAIHLLRTCLDPADELSLVRTLLSPAVGLTQVQLVDLNRGRKRPLWLNTVEAAEGDSETSVRLKRFITFWQEAQRQRWTLSPAMFVAWAVRQSGLQAAADAVGQRGLSKLLAVAHDYESSHSAETLPGLINHLRLVLEGDSREKAPELNSDADSVRILTAHASKGLEFPVVIAADCRQKVKPNRDFGPFHDPAVGLIFPDSSSKTHPPEFEERNRRTRNEARCLWYVTLTRAKRRLMITATDSKAVQAGAYEKADTFFKELWNKEVNAPTPGVVLGKAPAAVSRATETNAADVELAGRLEAARVLKAQLVERLRGEHVQRGNS